MRVGRLFQLRVVSRAPRHPTTWRLWQRVTATRKRLTPGFGKNQVSLLLSGSTTISPQPTVSWPEGRTGRLYGICHLCFFSSQPVASAARSLDAILRVAHASLIPSRMCKSRPRTSRGRLPAPPKRLPHKSQACFLSAYVFSIWRLVIHNRRSK